MARGEFIHAQIYSHAKSSATERFLHELVAAAPFPIRSIQVHGSSEFMAEFELACQKLSIPLIVLPPERPQYNGGVERRNRTFKNEFYRHPAMIADSLGAIRNELRKAVTKYNAYRPHAALNGATLSKHAPHRDARSPELPEPVHNGNQLFSTTTTDVNIKGLVELGPIHPLKDTRNYRYTQR